MSVASYLFQRNAELLLEDSFKNNVKVFNKLSMTFKIEKSHDGMPNKSIIEIYNLNKNSRELINERSSRPIKSKAKLSVGYQDELETLFIGDIQKTNSYKKSTEWITVLECGDAEEVILKQNFNKTYKAGTNENTIIEDVLGAMGQLGDDVRKILSGKPINFGVSINDTVGNVLNEYIGNQNKQWSIQNESLRITKPDETTNEQAIVLNKNSGLIGSPIKTDTGIKLRSLIQVGFNPGRGINVSSDLISGFYRIEKVIFQGETRSKNWYADIEAKTIKANPIVGAPIATNESTRLV